MAPVLSFSSLHGYFKTNNFAVSMEFTTNTKEKFCVCLLFYNPNQASRKLTVNAKFFPKKTGIKSSFFISFTTNTLHYLESLFTIA